MGLTENLKSCQGVIHYKSYFKYTTQAYMLQTHRAAVKLPYIRGVKAYSNYS